MRLTVLGLTSGTQLFSFASSSAIRRFPHSEFSSFIFTTRSSISLGVCHGSCGALLRFSKPA
jgi:hypothetical protein